MSSHIGATTAPSLSWPAPETFVVGESLGRSWVVRKTVKMMQTFRFKGQARREGPGVGRGVCISNDSMWSSSRLLGSRHNV